MERRETYAHDVLSHAVDAVHFVAVHHVVLVRQHRGDNEGGDHEGLRGLQRRHDEETSDEVREEPEEGKEWREKEKSHRSFKLGRGVHVPRRHQRPGP